MTSKVEQLRAEMLDERRWLLPKNPVEDGKGIANIDALISAAHAEGVAEGAEQESRKWLGAIELAVKEGTLGGFVSDALDNASVLAPTKEAAG